MLAKDLKPGTVINYNDAPHMIEVVNVQTPSARGGATLYKFRARNLLSRQKADFTCKGTENLADADFERRAVKLMYADESHLHLLDDADYNQYAISKEDTAEQLDYVTEDLEGMLALIYEDQCVGLQLPPAVTLEIIECDPAVKGNSATGRTKNAKLQTGLELQVPEYLTQGERIKIDTRTGQYLARA